MRNTKPKETAEAPVKLVIEDVGALRCHSAASGGCDICERWKREDDSDQLIDISNSDETQICKSCIDQLKVISDKLFTKTKKK